MQPPPTQFASPRAPLPPWVFAVIGCAGCGGIFSVIVLAAVLFPVFQAARSRAQAISCLANVKQSSLGLLMYSQDYDEVMPTAGSWMDSELPYVKSRAATIFHCPAVHVRGASAWGYAFNSTLSRKNIGSEKHPELSEMVYDSTNLEWDASDALTSLPDPGRHGFGSSRRNIVGYLDGHAEAVPTGGSRDSK